MLPANVTNHPPLFAQGALSQESNIRPESSLHVRETQLLLQPALSHYSEPSVRECADELSRVIDSIEDSVSFKHTKFSTPLIGSISNAIVRKERILGDHRLDLEFVVQLLVRKILRSVCT